MGSDNGTSGLVRELGGPVVAVAWDGSTLVQRGTHVEVLSPTLEQIQTLPIGDTTGQPGNWYGISPGAGYVAKVDRTGWIALWRVSDQLEVARLDPGPHLPSTSEMPLTGPAPQTALSWGAPAFLTADVLATHHGQGVVLWNVASGQARCALTDPALQIARETFGVGPERAVVRGSSNTPGVHNAVLIEFSMSDCSLLRRHLVPPARDIVTATGGGSSTFILSLRGIRVLDQNAVSQVRLSEDDLMPQAVYASQDGQTVAWAGMSRGITVGLWQRQENRLVTVAQLDQRERILHLRVGGGGVHGIDAAGRVWRWPVPSGGTTAQPVAVSADEQAYEQAILTLGLADSAAAHRQLNAIADTPTWQSTHFLRAYVQSLATNETPDAFRARVASEHIAYAGDPATLATADTLASAEVLGPALDMFLYWLEGMTPGAGPERGVELGLELSLQLSEAGDFETQTLVLGRLSQVYPDNERVREEMQELEDLDDE